MEPGPMPPPPPDPDPVGNDAAKADGDGFAPVENGKKGKKKKVRVLHFLLFFCALRWMRSGSIQLCVSVLALTFATGCCESSQHELQRLRRDKP